MIPPPLPWSVPLPWRDPARHSLIPLNPSLLWWWACAEPERPLDVWAWVDLLCPACTLKYDMERRTGRLSALADKFGVPTPDPGVGPDDLDPLLSWISKR